MLRQVNKMKISTKGRYALRMMIDLAENSNGNYVALKDISIRQEISLKYLEQIVTLLGKAGLIRSLRGPAGGYMLSRRPDEYTAGDIIRATEGALSPVDCVDEGSASCKRYGTCPTIDFWQGLYNVINEYINDTTLQDLLDKQKSINPPDYNI